MPEFDLTRGAGFGFVPAKQRKRSNVIEGTGAIDLDADYWLIYKDIDNLLDDIDFKDPDDREITRDIVDSLEKDAAKFMKQGLTVRIPFVCTLRRNPIEDLYKKHYKDLKAARQNMTKAEYKAYAKKLYGDCKRQDLDNQEARRAAARNKKKFQAQYDKLKDVHGEAYANLWLKSMTNFRVVEFDWDIEEAYQNAWKDE